MRPVASTPPPATQSINAGHAAPPPSGQNAEKDPPRLPPRTIHVYLPEDESMEPLTREKYEQLCESGKVKPSVYLDFLFCGKYPHPSVGRREYMDFMTLVEQLRESSEFPALEHLLERCGMLDPLDSMEVVDHEGLTEENASEFADILRRTQPHISTLLYSNAQPLSAPEALRKLSTIVGAFDSLRSFGLGCVGGEEVQAMTTVLDMFVDLKTFVVCEIELETEESRAAYCKALSSATGVKGIDLCKIVASDETKSALLRALAEPDLAKRLHTLKLNADDFSTPEHRKLLAALIRTMPSLEVLDLGSATNSVDELPALCEAINDCPSPLKQIHLEVNDDFRSLPSKVLETLAETARRRPGLQAISSFDEDTLWNYGDKSELSLPEHLREAKPGSSVWEVKLKEEALFSLSHLLRRNRALAANQYSTTYADSFANVPLPAGSDGFERDAGRLLAQNILAHSASVPQFVSIMTEVEKALAEKNGASAADAPTSTAASSASTTSSTSPNSGS